MAIEFLKRMELAPSKVRALRENELDKSVVYDYWLEVYVNKEKDGSVSEVDLRLVKKPRQFTAPNGQDDGQTYLAKNVSRA